MRKAAKRVRTMMIKDTREILAEDALDTNTQINEESDSFFGYRRVESMHTLSLMLRTTVNLLQKISFSMETLLLA